MNVLRKGFCLMWKAYVLLIIAALLFSGNFIAGKVAIESIPPFTLAFLRSGIAFLFMVLIFGKEWSRHKKVYMKAWKPLLGMSMTGVALFPALVYISLQYTTTINAAIVEALTPVVAILLGFVFLKDRFTKIQIVGVTLSIIGVLFIILRGNVFTLLDLSVNVGDLYMLLAVIVWAVYSIWVKQYGKQLPLYGSLLVMLFMASLMLLAVAAVFEWRDGLHLAWGIDIWMSLLYTSIFPAVLALIAWNRAVDEIGPSKASMFLNFVPVFTTVMAVLFLNETPVLIQAVGGIFVLYGVYLSTKPANEKHTADANVNETASHASGSR